MWKRALVLVLWFYAGWYAGAQIAYFLGVNPLLGPIMGVACAALFAGDPLGLIWKSARTASDAAQRTSVADLPTEPANS